MGGQLALYAATVHDQISACVDFYEAGHAFFNDTRPEAYAPEPATLAWERTLGFLREHLA